MIEKILNFLENMVDKNQLFFKIQLIKMSLKDLKLYNYSLPLLNRFEVMTLNTNFMPPDNCMIGKQPSRSMYKEKGLIKCWNLNYHLNVFEKALYNARVYKEILNNHAKIIEIKKNIYNRINNSNL